MNNKTSEELAKMIKNNVSGLPNFGIKLRNACFMNVGIQKIFTKKDAMIIVFNHGKTIDCTSSDTLKKNSPIWNLYKIAMAQLSKQDPYEYCLNLRRLYGEKDTDSSSTTSTGYDGMFYT